MPANNLKEFIAYAKANPGKLNFAVSGAGSGPHFGAEMFKRAAGLDIPLVFYKGSGPGSTDLLGGQVQVLMDAPSVTMAHVKAGKLKALAVTGRRGWRRSPTSRPSSRAASRGGCERLPGRARARRHAARGGGGAFGCAHEGARAAGGPRAVRAQGLDAAPSTPEQFGAHIRTEIEKWARVAKSANIKAG